MSTASSGPVSYTHLNSRRDANNKLERDEELTEDEVRREQAKVQKATDEYVAKVDEMLKSKEAEVMEI